MTSERVNGGGVDGDTSSEDTGQMQLAQRHYEPTADGDLTTAIVYALADARGVEATALRHPPLFEVVDVAGIEQAMFAANTRREPEKGQGKVEFTYEEFRVTVDSDGWIQVYENGDA